MKHFVPISLATALLVLGCTVTNNDNTDNNPDGGGPAPGLPDSSTPDDKDGGTDGSAPPQEIDEVPGNDSLDTAQAVPVGSRVKASMTNGEEDFFSVQIPDGAQDGVFRLTLDEASADYTPAITIYSSGKSQLDGKYAADGTTRPLTMEFHATAGKLYYVQVHGNGGSDTTIPYTLTPTFTPVPDTFERNDSFDTAKAAPVGQAFDLFLFAGAETNDGDDVDFFTVDAPAGKTKLRVQIENKSTADAAQTHAVTLYDSSKAQVDSAYASDGQADLDKSLDLPDGAGKLYVKFHNGVSATVASKVTLSFE